MQPSRPVHVSWYPSAPPSSVLFFHSLRTEILKRSTTFCTFCHAVCRPSFSLPYFTWRSMCSQHAAECTGCPTKWFPMLFCQNFYNQWNFFRHITHTHVYSTKIHMLTIFGVQFQSIQSMITFLLTKVTNFAQKKFNLRVIMHCVV